MREINGSNYGAGCHLDRVLADAINLARQSREVIKVSFNGYTRRVVNSSDLKKVSSRFFGHSPSRDKRIARARRKSNLALTRKAKVALGQLPSFLKEWAVSPKRFYGKRLSILLASEALQIARTYPNAQPFNAARELGLIVTSENHSGASQGLLFSVVKMILETPEDLWNFKN